MAEVVGNIHACAGSEGGAIPVVPGLIVSFKGSMGLMPIREFAYISDYIGLNQQTGDPDFPWPMRDV